MLLTAEGGEEPSAFFEASETDELSWISAGSGMLRAGWYALSDFVSAEGPFEAYLIFFRLSEVAGCFVAPRTLAGL